MGARERKVVADEIRRKIEKDQKEESRRWLGKRGGSDERIDR